jgi:hypothetical protein
MFISLGNVKGRENHLITLHDAEAPHTPLSRSERFDYRPAFDGDTTGVQPADTAAQLAIRPIDCPHGAER